MDDGIDDALVSSIPELGGASRQLLVVIPASREEYPRVVDLIRDGSRRRCLRGVHRAFGDAIREEQLARDLDLLDTNVP